MQFEPEAKERVLFGGAFKAELPESFADGVSIIYKFSKGTKKLNASYEAPVTVSPLVHSEINFPKSLYLSMVHFIRHYAFAFNIEPSVAVTLKADNQEVKLMCHDLGSCVKFTLPSECKR